MLTYHDLGLFFDQRKLAHLASTDFAPVLFLPKDGTEVLWQNSSCDKCFSVQEVPKVAVINPKDHFPVDYLRWCFLKKHSISHLDQSSHSSSSGPFSLSHHVCWHQKFGVQGKAGVQWKLQDFVEHIREEKRMWHSSCLFIWGALCTAISSPKGWNIFYAWHTLHFNRFPDRRSHICAMS